MGAHHDWQQRCDHCAHFVAHNGTMHLEKDEQGKPMGRFTSHDSKKSVERFVAENNLAVDWSRAYVSSTGSINGRRYEFWRLPVIEREAPSSQRPDRCLLCAAEWVVYGVAVCDRPATVALATEQPVYFKMSDMLGPKIGPSAEFYPCAEHVEAMAHALAKEQGGVAPSRDTL